MISIKKNYKYFLSVIVVLCLYTSLKAQSPSFFKLGEDELSGIDIYDIIQDKNNVYWLATNQGIIKYNGYEFTFIECSEMLNSSVFSFKMDKSNNLYCNNLSGQIFKIKDNTCKVFFQLPDSLMSPYLYYEFDDLNNLIIATNCLFKVTKKKEIEILVPSNNSFQRFSEIFKTKDGSLFTYDGAKKQLSTIKNNTINFKDYSKNVNEEIMLNFFYLNNKLFFYNRLNGVFLKPNDLSASEVTLTNNDEDKLSRFYSDNTNLWISGQSGGVKIFDNNLNPLFNGNSIFKGTIISSLYKDHEGNSILGTFGEGLIIISNFNSIEIKIPDENNKATRITKGNNNKFYVGTQSGKIYQIDSLYQTSMLVDNGEKNIEFLEFIPELNQLLYDKKFPTFIQVETKKETVKKYGAIKDIFQIKNKLYLVAANNGVSWLNFYQNTPEVRYVNLFKERTNCIGYDSINKVIYAGTSLGLKIGNEEKSEFFRLHNKNLICRDILFFNGKILISTQNNGILVFKNNKLIDQWTTKRGIVSNTVKHIKNYQNTLFISTNVGIQILSEEGKPLSILNKSTGLYTNNVIDFEIASNKLWIVHQKGIQTIDVRHIQENNFKPSLTLSQLIVNDSIMAITLNNFSYTKNKFEFVVSSISIKNSDEISYKYILEGLDKKWQINPYKDNKIEYKSLPAGEYTFKIKALYRNNESNLITYSFNIFPPFWITWWFYSLLAFIFIVVTILIYRYQLKKQQKKIELENELNASKLIAIQSQMNPHFIFNAINSIQDLILQGDIDNSYSYIIKFSKLVRKTLDYSGKEFIDIEDEIELLEIYLELEKLRFKDDFVYEVNSGNIDDIQVPPMLIQPFVENAIKHGLLHKEGTKHLSLTFVLEDTLKCIVEDNGIGRKKAQEIKNRQQKTHKSFSVNATETRFNIMKSHYQQDLGIHYQDLYKNGEPIGTKVIIQIPINRNY